VDGTHSLWLSAWLFLTCSPTYSSALGVVVHRNVANWLEMSDI
jgi:hypothetical protein